MRRKVSVKNFDNRYGYVYLVTNRINGKRYIGKTVLPIEDRWSAHVSHARKGQKTMALHGAIRKYGPESFEVCQLCIAKEDCLGQLERFLIKHYGTRTDTGYGYNMTDGGDGVSGCIPSLETRQKMSQALVGNKRSLGKRMTESNKDKLKAAIRAKVFTPEIRARMSAAQIKPFCRRGHELTEENVLVWNNNRKQRKTRVCKICYLIRKPLKGKKSKVQTHCKAGHFRTEENTYVFTYKGETKRRCKICDKARVSKRRCYELTTA